AVCVHGKDVPRAPVAKCVEDETYVVLARECCVALARERDDVHAWRVVAANGEYQRVRCDERANDSATRRRCAFGRLDLREYVARVGQRPRRFSGATICSEI